MKDSAYVGIDPGVSGGIAVLSDAGEIVLAKAMPASDEDLFDVFDWIARRERVEIAGIERVSASPQMGVVSAFTFGRGYGRLRMAVCATHMPLEDIAPAKWQRALGCLTRGDKNVSKAKASTFFPGHKMTHAIADALLIAQYVRMKYRYRERETA